MYMCIIILDYMAQKTDLTKYDRTFGQKTIHGWARAHFADASTAIHPEPPVLFRLDCVRTGQKGICAPVIATQAW